jgi:IS30 family transposase
MLWDPREVMEYFKEKICLETIYEQLLKAQRDLAGIYNTEYMIGIPIQSCGPYWTQ